MPRARTEPEDTDGEEILEESEHSADDSDQGELPITSSPHKGKGKESTSANIIVQTSFDAYFSYTASKSQTSTNVFSSLVEPLTTEEYNDAISFAKPRLKTIQPIISTPSIRNSLFSRFLIELQEGFNIICYGYGSKRSLLNQFATEYCSKKGHVVIANGFQPQFTIKDLLNQIENVPGILDLELSSSTPEKQAQRISKFFTSSSLNLYIIIHNIDSATLRAPRAKSILSLLALTPNIHIIASIDHINAPLIWSSSESSTRKPSPSTTTTTTTTTDNNNTETIPPRGYAWLYHDLTTLAPYDFELTFTDRTSLSSAHGGGPRKKPDTSLTPAFGTTASGTTTTNMTETAALHILASVTQKAQKLFTLLGTKQLESIEELGSGTTTQPKVDLQACGMGYDTLFNLARDNFIATNDTALRALLGEYRDHGLVVSAQAGSGSGEILWIPLRSERLASVLRSLQTEQQ